VKKLTHKVTFRAIVKSERRSSSRLREVPDLLLFECLLVPRECEVSARRKTSLKSIPVLVADCSRMTCQLLADALEKSPYGLRIVACAHNSAEVIRTANQRNPRVAVLSANLEDGHLTGIRAMYRLCAAHPKTLVILLMDSPDRDVIVDAFRAGAKGVFSRSEPAAVLAKCIRAVHSGQIWANARELQFLLEALSQRVAPRLVDSKGKAMLTKREEEVVRLVTEGLTNKEISRKLSLSEHTIKNYMFRLFEKLGVSNRVELILYAFRQHGSDLLPSQEAEDP
jgi:DNA-binding NarL/FixJ family response regulator